MSSIRMPPDTTPETVLMLRGWRTAAGRWRFLVEEVGAARHRARCDSLPDLIELLAATYAEPGEPSNEEETS